MTSIHLPVLLENILCEWLDSLVSAVDRGPITIVDGTFGGGGHSLQIARRLKEGDTLIGIDRDPLPIERFIKSAPSATDHTGPSPAVAVSSEERWVEYSAVLPSGCRLVLSCASYCAVSLFPFFPSDAPPGVVAWECTGRER